jgi:hypothetical protein
MEAALETQVSPRLAAREPLPCRGLLLGRLWPDRFRDDLASLHLPARTLALLSGEAEGWSPIEAAAVKIAHSLATVLAGRLRAGEAFVEAYRPDVAGLTGLGPGLTPTGDDLLVGLAAMACRLAAAGLVERRAAAAYHAVLADVPLVHTTPAALALRANASKGLYPSVLAAFTEALGSAEPPLPSLAERVRLLAATGAHSGADLLAGALALALGIAFPLEAG